MTTPTTPTAPEPKRELACGVYESTQAFKSIEKHSCVFYADDLGLVAVTGPADDELSQKYTEFFSSAPALAARVAELEAALKNLLTICEIAEFYMPGELAENSKRVSRDIETARRLLGGAK